MRRFPAKAEALDDASVVVPSEVPAPILHTIEVPQIATMADAMTAVVVRQTETQEILSQLIEVIAEQKDQVIRVKIIRDMRTGNMNELIITKE